MSKVPPELIQKFNLKRLKAEFGQSFINDCSLYLWPNAIKGAKVHIMDGDLECNRLKAGSLMIWVTFFQPLTDERPVKCSITHIVTTESLLDIGDIIIADIKSRMVNQ